MTTGHVKDWHAIYIFWRQPLVVVVFAAAAGVVVAVVVVVVHPVSM